MKRLHLNGYQRHILIVALLGLYLATANQIYIQFFLDNGRPAPVQPALPAESGEVRYKLGEMRAVRIDGEDVYELKGFAYNADAPLHDYNITILLVSDDEQIAFPTTTPEFPGLIRSSKGYKDGMDEAEFRALISKQVLDAGVYRIGILLEEKYGKERLFTITEGSLNKTANTMRFKAGS